MAMQDALCLHLPSCFGTQSYQPTSAFNNEGTAAGRVFNSCAATFHEGKNWNRHIWETHQSIFWRTFVCFYWKKYGLPGFPVTISYDKRYHWTGTRHPTCKDGRPAAKKPRLRSLLPALCGGSMIEDTGWPKSILVVIIKPDFWLRRTASHLHASQNNVSRKAWNFALAVSWFDVPKSTRCVSCISCSCFAQKQLNQVHEVLVACWARTGAKCPMCAQSFLMWRNDTKSCCLLESAFSTAGNG